MQRLRRSVGSAALGAALSSLALGAPACRGVLGIDDLPAAPGASDAGDLDAADAAEAYPPYCASLSPAPQLCADFDNTTVYGDGWDNGTQNPDPGALRGGTLALDRQLFESGPASIVMTTPPLLQTTDSAAGILLKTLPSVTPRLSVDFDVFISTEDIPAGQGFVILASVDYGIGAVLVLRDASGPGVGVVPDFNSVPIAARFPVGAWHRISLLIVNAPSDGGPDGFVLAGIDAPSGGFVTLPAKYQQVKTKPHLTVGPSSQGPIGAFKVNIDNVRVYYGN